ncbi:MAG: FitA-like ribbon-helix-helix domain-containing protein [Pyrinomonadaceae bacterium]
MATLTIKNFPDDLYADLTLAAKTHRRSINSEAIVSVERGLDRNVSDSNRALLERIRAHREKLAKQGFTVTDEILAESRKELVRRSERVLEELTSSRPSEPQRAPKKRQQSPKS